MSSREAELSNAQSRVYQYNQYPPQQSYQQQQPFSPPGGGGYYLPQSYAPLQGYKQPPPQQQQYGECTLVLNCLLSLRGHSLSLK